MPDFKLVELARDTTFQLAFALADTAFLVIMGFLKMGLPAWVFPVALFLDVLAWIWFGLTVLLAFVSRRLSD